MTHGDVLDAQFGGGTNIDTSGAAACGLLPEADVIQDSVTEGPGREFMPACSGIKRRLRPATRA